MSLIPRLGQGRRKRLLLGLIVFTLSSLAGLSVMAANGWLPRTDPLTGRRTGWFGRELSSPSLAAMPSGTPQLSKEYIYAGSRLLAVEDANAGVVPTPTPSPSPTPHGFEADVAARYLGDGSVLSNDVTIVRAFVIYSATPQAGTNERQRADVAPLMTLGDCVLDATDVTVTRNYAAALHPLTPAGGPTEPCGAGGGSSLQFEGGMLAAQSDEATPSNREVRVNPATGRNGQTVSVPVFMNMERDEMALAFTLEYDATKLRNPRVTLNSELPPSSVLSVNANHPGKIGILIDAEEPFSQNPRELRIVFVTFDIRQNAPAGPVPLYITDSLARKSVSDRQGNLAPTRYTNGTVSVTR